MRINDSSANYAFVVCLCLFSAGTEHPLLSLMARHEAPLKIRVLDISMGMKTRWSRGMLISSVLLRSPEQIYKRRFAPGSSEISV